MGQTDAPLLEERKDSLCREVTNPATQISRSVKPSISRKAMNIAVSGMRRLSGEPGLR
jgi:hypothetical protein